MPLKKSGHIYAIGMVGAPYVKIGSTSQSVMKRLKQLQTAHPHPLSVLVSIPVSHELTRIESWVRRFLAEERSRLEGEWFEGMITADQLQALVVRAIEKIMHEESDLASVPARNTSWNIAARVDECRREKGWTRGELARRAQLNQTHVWKILDGQRARVEGNTVKRLARALGVTTDYLLGMDIKDDAEGQ